MPVWIDWIIERLGCVDIGDCCVDDDDLSARHQQFSIAEVSNHYFFFFAITQSENLCLKRRKNSKFDRIGSFIFAYWRDGRKICRWACTQWKTNHTNIFGQSRKYQQVPVKRLLTTDKWKKADRLRRSQNNLIEPIATSEWSEKKNESEVILCCDEIRSDPNIWWHISRQ